MSHHDQNRHDFAFLAGVVVGAISGALATMALTPMSGQETREKLRARAGDLGPVKERASSVASSAREAVATGREKAADLAAKSPLPIGHARAGETGEGHDTIVSSATLPPVSGASAGSSTHPEEPAEGRTDVGAPGANRDEMSQARSPGGHGSRTPHPDDPAEGA